LLGAAGSLLSCSTPDRDALAEIREAGTLRLITENNAHCYYLYRDAPAGFEHDLAHAFASSLGVELEVLVPGWDRMLGAVAEGDADLVGASLTVTPGRAELVDFSDPYLRIRQHVVVHKRNYGIRRIADLNGQELHVRRGTSYHERLLELMEQGLDIHLVLHENTPTDELLRRVAEGEIDITVADTNIALLNRRYYPTLRMAFSISEMQSIAWAVQKENHALLDELNRFLTAIRNDGTFGRIYRTYYVNVEAFDYHDLRTFHRRVARHLPRYEDTIKREAERYGLDWSLVAAVIYQESHFDPESESRAGALGLMQLTERAALDTGVEDRLDPQQSIQGGVKYLRTMAERFEHLDEFNKTAFALASYNIGHGHVRDAQILAEQKNLDVTKWSAVRTILPLLADREYYQHAQYGYARGTEPVRYVDRVLVYYDILKRKALDSTFALGATGQPAEVLQPDASTGE
jgi:membrane-bound lytic murein transglycosylase F